MVPIPYFRGQGDSRALEQVFGPIRQALADIEKRLGNTTAQASKTAQTVQNGTSSAATLQQQITNLVNQVAALQQSGSVAVATYRADVVVATDQVVFESSDGGVALIDPLDPTQVFAAVGIATASASIGGNVQVRRSGVHTLVGAAFEPGRVVYASTDSYVTQTPSYAAWAVPIGVALTATTFAVMPGWPSLLDEPVYLDGFEAYVPVTLRLLRDVVDNLSRLPDPDDLSPVSALSGDELMSVKSPSSGLVQCTAQQVADLFEGVPDPDAVAPVSGLVGDELLTLKRPAGGFVQVTVAQLLSTTP